MFEKYLPQMHLLCQRSLHLLLQQDKTFCIRDILKYLGFCFSLINVQDTVVSRYFYCFSCFSSFLHKTAVEDYCRSYCVVLEQKMNISSKGEHKTAQGPKKSKQMWKLTWQIQGVELVCVASLIIYLGKLFQIHILVL